MECIQQILSFPKILRFRFLDIQYNRNEDYKTVIKSTESMDTNNEHMNADKKPLTTTTTAKLVLDDHDDIETTVMFLPNVWSLMPTTSEYNKLVEQYKNYVENPPAPPVVVTKTEAQTTPTPAPAASNKPSDTKPTTTTTETTETTETTKHNSEMADEGAVTAIAIDEPVECENTIETMTKSLKALNLLIFIYYKFYFYLNFFFFFVAFLIYKNVPNKFENFFC